MRTIGLVSALIAIVGLILVEFLFRDQLQRSSEREKVEATHRISLPNAIASIYMITDQDGRSNRVRLMERRTLVRALFLGRGADNPPQLFSFQNLFFQE
jgi:hypothetical protein